MSRKYELTLNETKTPLTIERSSQGILQITIGETTYPVQIIQSNQETGKYQVKVGEEKYLLTAIQKKDMEEFIITLNKQEYRAALKQLITRPSVTRRAPPPSTQPVAIREPTPAPSPSTEPGTVTAPLPGRVLDVPVKEGDLVKQGEVIIVLEAMKMANKIRAPKAGNISKIHVEFGDAVEKGQALVTVT
jgi:glutaconyl-CoA decarboxylase